MVNVLVSQILGGDILAGGWRKGDRVRTRIDLKVKNVGESTVGSVMGPCNDTGLAERSLLTINR